MKIEILEGNKLIAEFMGAKIEIKDKVHYPNNNHDWEIHLAPYIIHERRYGSVEDLIEKFCKYHLSWDWLMPVVEKIGNYEISRGHCWFWRTNDIGEEKEISNQEADSTIEATWLAVVDFIKWYNQNINQ